MNANQVAGFLDDHPCCWISEGEDPLVRLNFPLSDILLESVSQFLGDIDYFAFSSCFCLSEDELSVFNILWLQFQNLSNPHATSGHKLEQETISWFSCSKDDLINQFFFNDVPAGKVCLPEEFPEYGGITWIFQILFDCIANEVEKGGKQRIPNPSGSLSCTLSKSVEKGQEFI